LSKRLNPVLDRYKKRCNPKELASQLREFADTGECEGDWQAEGMTGGEEWYTVHDGDWGENWMLMR